MSNPYLAQELARDHERAVRRSAAARHLATLAACCRPSRLRAAAHRLRERRDAAACCA
jgi:hypothetical protein